MGLFHAFFNDRKVHMIGVEAAGSGLHTDPKFRALEKGEVGVLHGSKKPRAETKDGQINRSPSVAAGLIIPASAPSTPVIKNRPRAICNRD